MYCKNGNTALLKVPETKGGNFFFKLNHLQPFITGTLNHGIVTVCPNLISVYKTSGINTWTNGLRDGKTS